MEDKNIDKIIKAIEKGFSEINKTIDSHLEDEEQSKQMKEERGKAIFEFPANSHDVKVIIKRYDIISALNELSNYRRTLEKYGVPNEIYVQNGKILSDEELNNYNRTMEDIEQTRSYIPITDVINKIDDVLGGLWEIYGEY